MTDRILFVDDEAHVLQGTRRMLRSRRGVWDMAFATSGDEALALFQAQPFDVVVTDMRMPGMDGAALLEHIQQLAPETIRIILSGFSDKEAILRTVGPAHQYLAKPTAAEDLISAISRSLHLRQSFFSAQADPILGRLKTLPAAPRLYQELLSAMRSFDGNVDHIVAVLSSDPALAAQTLKLTNSAFYGLAEQTTSLTRAVQVLGFETLRALALKSDLFQACAGGPELKTRLDRLAQRSYILGQVCANIARHENLPADMVESAMTTGLVSHVGTVGFLVGAPTQFDAISQTVDATLTCIVDAEVAEFGCDHAQMGAYFLGLWAFIDPIVEAVAYHHEPTRRHAPPADLTAVLHAAQALCRRQETHETTGLDLDMAYLTASGYGDRLDEWGSIAEKTLKSSGQISF